MKYKSTNVLQNVNHATRELEIDTEHDRDAMAIHKRNIEISKNIMEGKIDANVYLGQNAGVIYAEKSEKDINKYKVTGSLGPMRAPTNLRVNCRFDYAPGICKDYKETGYCGFGDGCVFMHDRGDYKTGWELEEEWKREQQQKQRLIREGKYKEESDEEEYSSECEVPMLCAICDEDFVNPVVTKCQHYFCERCAISHYGKSSTCFVCKKSTQGIFNNCETLINKIKDKRKQRKDQKQSKQVKNHHVSSEHINHINDEERDNMKYLENRDTDELELDEEIKPEKKKKNNFKVQNSWLYVSDYKSYD
jgi:RING finger protein 113A